MLRNKTWVVAALPTCLGFGLILNGLWFTGIVLLLVAAGMLLADFRWSEGAYGAARLVARGSPALLMVALMLGAAQGFVVAKDAVLPVLTAQVAACPAETGRDLLIVRALDLLL